MFWRKRGCIKTKPDKPAGVVRAELKNVQFELVKGELEELLLAQGEAFCVPITMQIGPLGEPGADLFDLKVCSPAWLAEEVARFPVVHGGKHLFMLEFNEQAVRTAIEKRLRHAVGRSWSEVAHKIMQWANWQYEDYPV